MRSASASSSKYRLKPDKESFGNISETHSLNLQSSSSSKLEEAASTDQVVKESTDKIFGDLTRIEQDEKIEILKNSFF